MAIQTYTIYNNSPTLSATINYITIDTNLAQIQHHLDLTGWLSPFNGYTDFQGASTLQTVTKTYVDDVSPINRTYVSHTGTNIKLDPNNTGIQPGWDVSGAAFTSGQTVVSTSGTTWVILSAPPTIPPTGGAAITFSPPDNLLILNNISGIGVGWLASGTGYSGQTVLGTSGSDTLIMSAPPSTTPSGSITFTSNEDTMLVIPAGSSRTFAMDYDSVTSTLGTYTSTVAVHATLGTAVIEYVNNFLVISSLPVTDPASPFYVPDFGGGGGGEPGAPNPPECDPNPNASSQGCANTGNTGSADAADPGATGPQ
jgi:hypothetical protein